MKANTTQRNGIPRNCCRHPGLEAIFQNICPIDYQYKGIMYAARFNWDDPASFLRIGDRRYISNSVVQRFQPENLWDEWEVL